MKFEEFGSDDELSLLWEHRLPVYKNEEPFIGGGADNNENLYVYLDPINSDQMNERFGKEKVVKEFDNIIVTLGRFKGGRYIYKNEKGEYVGVINYTKLGRDVVISNIYVRPDYRRKNIASQLVDIVKRDYPKITVDTHMTDLGGKFFGYKESITREFAHDYLLEDNIPDILDGKPTKNNLGQLIHPTEEGIRNFWRWFGNSKTVDSSGRPIVCYHATSSNFTVVNMKKGTQGFFWFTSNLSEIEDQSIGASGYDRVMQLYIKMDRPADWNAYDRLMTFQIKRDYDGTMLVDPDGTFSGFVFEPTQVKSTKNKGTFSPEIKKINQ